MRNGIFLLSDFGSEDTYVAQMKAVLLSNASKAALVDLTHEVAAGDVLQGAFHLWACRKALPEGSVVLAVVDPGVGPKEVALPPFPAVSSTSGRITASSGFFRRWSSAGCLTRRPIPAIPFTEGTCSRRRRPGWPSIPGWFYFLDPLSLETTVPLNIQASVRRKGLIESTVVHVGQIR